ncbi:hypothetical protein J0H58_03045 [bacterium]|nr:hypothetical protein [bacterium]
MEIATRPPAPPPPPRDIWAHVAWAGLFAVNLVVSVLLGAVLTHRGGWVGMVAGVGVMFAVWQVVVPRHAALRAALIPGAMALAVAQFFPLVHYLAGTAAVLVVCGGREPFSGAPLTELEGFAATALTGVLLWCAAAVIGVALRLADRCLVWAFDRLAVVDAAGRPGGGRW